MPAAKGNKYAKGNKGGRPKAEFKKEYCEQVYEICLLGATDEDIARFFKISKSTLNRWKKDHEEFWESATRGKEVADAKVAKALFERATGYSHAETKFFHHKGQVIEAETIAHYPPDTKAIEFWLKNRQPDKWRDKIQVSGDPDNPLVIKSIGFEDVNPEDEDE